MLSPRLRQTLVVPTAALFLAGCIPSSGGPSIPPIPSSCRERRPSRVEPGKGRRTEKGQDIEHAVQGKNPDVSESPTAGRGLMPRWHISGVPDRVYETHSVGATEERRSRTSQPPRVPADMKMAECQGAGVGDVVGLRKAGEAELGLDGVLNLRLGGTAAAGERFLHPGRGVTEDGDTAQRPPGRSHRGRAPSRWPCAGT